VTHSDFAALRHDDLKRFKGASLYKVSRPAFYKNINDGMSLCDRTGLDLDFMECGQRATFGRRPYFYIVAKGSPSGERE
jgi:predicted AAA+ superfamily ATPase